MSDPREEMIACVPNLRAFARSMCGDATRADDLVQETMMKAWAARDRFEPGTDMRAWLFTILRNAYYSELRKRKREIEDADGKFAARLATPPEQIGRTELADLQNALNQLPDEQREALILVSASGLSYEEAAQIADCAVGTIKSRINRGRARLAQLLDVSGEADLAPSAEMDAAISAAR